MRNNQRLRDHLDMMYMTFFARSESIRCDEINLNIKINYGWVLPWLPMIDIMVK